MSIIQISKIQQRSGDLVDLPQLDQAELGFASDVNKLFIGKTAGNTENIEVLTAYSNIAFSQLEGALGNLDITAPVSNGQVLVYDGNNWVNRGGNTGGYINLGEASNVNIDGGALGYILTTDGAGNLSWSPKGLVLQNIQTISAANPGRMTLKNPYPFPQGAAVTINNISGNGLFATNLNGNTFFLKTVPGNLQLYDLYLNNNFLEPNSTLNTSTYGAYPDNTGVVIWNTVSTTGSPGGGNRSIQFNSENVSFGGDNDLLYDYLTNTLTLNGTANVTTLNTSLNATGNVAGIIRPTAGTGANGIIFPADPGGGSGDLATIKYYAVTGESTVLELAVTNDPDDSIRLNATGGTKIDNALTVTNITTGDVSNAGTITGNWALTAGSRFTATYADLAEYYAADKNYTPGTVLEFGGEKEVTVAGIESNKIAGVVSTEPAYVMNGNIQAENPVMIALIGRAPVKVIGYVNKGDMLISAGQGLAKTSTLTPKIGTVIGKAITNKLSEGEGIVEVMLGRM